MTPRRIVAVLALLPGLYAALPALEWCPFTWLECVESTFPRCEGSAAALPASCAVPCDPTPDPPPFGDRAWCIHPAPDAIAVRSTDPPVPALALRMLPAAVELPIPSPAAFAHRDRAVLPPVLIAPHAPPQGRAPPEC